MAGAGVERAVESICSGASQAAVLAALLLVPASGAARDVILSWQDTVLLEHQDRTARLRRLSDATLNASPRFFESRVPRRELPASFNTDIPVLRVVFGQQVFFDTDRAELRPEAEAVIDVVAEALRREASDTAVFISGHTDSRGGDAYNFDLSVRRAETVAQALKRRGVRQATIWRIGFGEAVPLVPNTSDEAMTRNRRVEFLFGRKPEAVGAWLAKQEALVCAGAEPRQRAACLRSFALLPRVEAAPVTSSLPERRTVAIAPADVALALPTIQDSDLVSIVPPARVAVTPEGATPAVVARPPPPERTVVTITRDDPIVIDLREQRVLVPRPDR
ncbi:OmpA family protein [Methylobacterium sp. Leaf399]|uniref:OmpA family protein n=1 Tax=Methylobacterium sp. Leaf399 TaxID=1736364 RepID=UPI00138F0B6B|nr:OmpA family protein [Methylobacterium sp. Leaf399]